MKENLNKKTLQDFTSEELTKVLNLTLMQDLVNSSREKYALLTLRYQIEIEKLCPDYPHKQSIYPEDQLKLDKLNKIKEALDSLEWNIRSFGQSSISSILHIVREFEINLMTPEEASYTKLMSLLDSEKSYNKYTIEGNPSTDLQSPFSLYTITLFPDNPTPIPDTTPPPIIAEIKINSSNIFVYKKFNDDFNNDEEKYEYPTNPNNLWEIRKTIMDIVKEYYNYVD